MALLQILHPSECLYIINQSPFFEVKQDVDLAVLVV